MISNTRCNVIVVNKSLGGLAAVETAIQRLFDTDGQIDPTRKVIVLLPEEATATYAWVTYESHQLARFHKYPRISDQVIIVHTQEELFALARQLEYQAA